MSLMNDLTIIYYTANTIKESVAQKVRDYLLKTTENKIPIISVSQKPLDFGKNICVGEIGKSKYNCYKQILVGAKAAKTRYVACAEDDTLYSKDHFNFRPPNKETFYYDTNMWFCTNDGEYYYWRKDILKDRGGMWGCIVATETLVTNLTKRFSVYPVDPLPSKSLHWGEPGYHDHQYGMKNKAANFESEDPNVVFLYRESMGGRHTILHNRLVPTGNDNISYNLQSFGGASKLWGSYWG